MPKYLAMAAVWVEGEDHDDVADRVQERLGDGLRADGTVGQVVVFKKAETFKPGFLIDLERFDLGEVVTGIKPDERKTR